MRLQGKNALITGAGRGIGMAIAHKFMQEGASVVFCDVDRQRVGTAQADLQSYGTIYGTAADVSNPVDVDQLIVFAMEKLGSIDILVNNAGVAAYEPFLDISLASWNRVLGINLTGTFLCSQAVARHMVSQKSGAIVNMASTNGILGEAGLAHYNASKAGIVLLSKTMAIELAPHHIRVNSLCPGLILTELQMESGADEADIKNYTSKIPLSRYGKMHEVANACAFLASDEASFITGTELVVDGGQICQE